MTQRQADSERQNETKYLKGKLTEIELGAWRKFVIKICTKQEMAIPLRKMNINGYKVLLQQSRVHTVQQLFQASRVYLM